MKGAARYKRRARFMPVQLDNLRDDVRSLIGLVADWNWQGTSDDDKPYPGQARWTTDDERFAGRWVPDEDLQDVSDE